mmetsp:Transcript_5180/g.13178  ORF Transcript_5180/g.13178 Transcript_5180/m.13178 type:complete len:193 (-) Transcript_5180:364-942(-)
MSQRASSSASGGGVSAGLLGAAAAGYATRRKAHIVTTPRAFVPNMMPNPQYRWGDDSNPNGPGALPTLDALLAKHAKWQVGHEHGADDTDTIWRKFKCRDGAAGHKLLEAIQGSLYQTNEKGCRIRRETQGLYYMCCDGVRVRLNEPKHEVLVEVPMPMETHDEMAHCKDTLDKVEEMAKQYARGGGGGGHA